MHTCTHIHFLRFVCRAITHTLKTGNYGQFRDTNQSTTDVFGLSEETRVPEGNPQGMRIICKLYTHKIKNKKINNNQITFYSIQDQLWNMNYKYVKKTHLYTILTHTYFHITMLF